MSPGFGFIPALFFFVVVFSGFSTNAVAGVSPPRATQHPCIPTKASLVLGRKHGLELRCHNKHTPRDRRIWFHGKPHGLWKFWSRRGHLLELEHWFYGVRHGLRSQRIGQTLRLSRYIGGRLHGERELFFLKKVHVSSHSPTLTLRTLIMTQPWVAGVRHGVEVRYFPNGRLRARVQWKKGKRHGTFRELSRFSHTLVKATYQNGELHGRWQSWYPSGERLATGQYQHNSPEGLWKHWWKNGRLQTRGTWHFGELEGKWESWWKNGQRKSRGHWKSADVHGRWIHWHPNGRKRAVFRYRKGKAYGVQELWNDKGQRLTLTTFRHGKAHGRWRFYWPSGKVRSEGQYQKDKKHGSFQFWDANGRLRRQERYHRGKETGLWKRWDRRGTLRYKGTFYKGQPHGWETRWYANGEIQRRGFWDSGRPAQTWRFWNKSGRFRGQHHWSAGKCRQCSLHLLNKADITKEPLLSSSAAPEVSRLFRRQLKRLRKQLRHASARMPCLKYPLDDSFCHIGAAYSAMLMMRQNRDVTLIQPTPYHMLSRFQFDGQTVYVDQFMAQFFLKGSPPHRSLTRQGGFAGTLRDFKAFWEKAIDYAEAWGEYNKGGYLPVDAMPRKQGLPSYRYFLTGVPWKRVNSRKARVRRVMRAWYGDFQTDTTFDQSTGLFWTARYFLHHFQLNFPHALAPRCPQ